MRLCHLVPFCRLTLETSLSPEACANLLREQIARQSWTGRLQPSGASGPPFRGWVTPRKFKILRNPGRRDGWQPVVIGRMKPTANGTRIRIRMRLMIPGYLAAVALHLLTTAFAIAVIVAFVHEGRPFGLLVLAVYVLGLALVLRSFWAEAMYAQRFLLSLFGEPEAETSSAPPSAKRMLPSP